MERHIQISENISTFCCYLAFTQWPKSSNCSSLKTCLGKKDFTAAILFQDNGTRKEIISIANILKLAANINNQGWWCS